MNTFEMKTVIHFGENALERLKDIPYKRVLIITDPFVVQSKYFPQCSTGCACR